jgi:pimeloyl-ACP methyl ester carboxylesterase
MTYRHVTAPTPFVEANGIRFAYRRFGQERGTPLSRRTFGAGSIIRIPRSTTALRKSTDHSVRLRGGRLLRRRDAGHHRYDGGARRRFCRGLKISRIDLLGFSIGRYIAQTLAMRHPETIRRLILVAPARGQVNRRMIRGTRSIKTGQSPLEAYLYLFFRPSESSQEAGLVFWARRHARKDHIDVPTSAQTMAAQRVEITDWRRPCGRAVRSRCWPSGSTSSVLALQLFRGRRARCR